MDPIRNERGNVSPFQKSKPTWRNVFITILIRSLTKYWYVIIHGTDRNIDVEKS